MLFDTGLEKTVDITIPAYAKRIGILVSGGLDSGVLLCLLLTLLKNGYHGKDVQVLNVLRGAGTEVFCEKVVERACEHFKLPKLPINSVYVDRTTHHSRQVSDPIRGLLLDKKIDFVFSGDTANPETEMEGVIAPVRDSPKNQSAYLRWSLPFLHISKDHVVSMMFKYGFDFIAEVSHSCTDRDEGRCGVCFQCKERNWAFLTLKREDKGFF